MGLPCWFRAVVLHGGSFVSLYPKDNVWRYFSLSQLGVCVWMLLLVSSMQGPGILQNILQCTGESSQKRIIWFKISVVQRWRNPSVRQKGFIPELHGGEVDIWTKWKLHQHGRRRGIELGRTTKMICCRRTFCTFFVTNVIGDTCSSFLQNISGCLCQTVLWPERAIGLTQSGVAYLPQACCQTLRIGCHLWQEISQD